MRVVTLPDGAISANVLAAAGSPIFLGTADVSGGSGVTFLGAQGNTNGDGQAIAAGDTVIVLGGGGSGEVDLTNGNALRITYGCTAELGVGSGLQCDLQLDVLIDDVPFVLGTFNTQLRAIGTAGQTFKQDACRSFFVQGLSSDVHTVRLQGIAGSSTGQTVFLEGGVYLQVELYNVPA